ncbi:hypothetical protein ASZ90_010195 [hydrocarbon metagenome]|uniref:Uncharacterized protein n=1 Tax=hydrocarbon metagenome TaxID=938273 RepID=A0A0W8FGS5_9ZZZZ
MYGIELSGSESLLFQKFIGTKPCGQQAGDTNDETHMKPREGLPAQPMKLTCCPSGYRHT